VPLFFKEEKVNLASSWEKQARKCSLNFPGQQKIMIEKPTRAQVSLDEYGMEIDG